MRSVTTLQRRLNRVFRTSISTHRKNPNFPSHFRNFTPGASPLGSPHLATTLNLNLDRLAHSNADLSGYRVLHFVRHAESMFNCHPDVDGTIDGFFNGMTDVDVNLSPKGYKQASELGLRIAMIESRSPYSIRNVETVISSPLTRAILTAKGAFPTFKYPYIIRPEITEQIENTSDIGRNRDQLCDKFPDLKDALSTLNDGWWWRHPIYTHNSNSGDDVNTIDDATIDPHIDAKLLLQYSGKTPAAEPTENVIYRSKQFLHWLNNSNYRNVAIVSHSCTLKFVERMLHRINGESADVSVSYFANTEVRSLLLPINASHLIESVSGDE